jgi:hypothetical protein
MAGHDVAHAGRWFPNAPRYGGLAVVPADPTTVSTLGLVYTCTDLDGDPEGATVIRWYRNGTAVPELDGRREVPPELTRKREKWHFTVQDEEDFKTFGAGKGGHTFAAPPVTIRNTPPTSPVVALEPRIARTQDDLKSVISTQSVDVDGDPIAYRYRWLKNGVAQRLPANRADVPARSTRKEETWQVVVTPHDGEADGAPGSAAVTIANTPPRAPVVALQPKAPRTTDDVQAVVVTPATDDDGDPVTYRYVWAAGEERLNLPLEVPVLPAVVTRRDIAVTVTVTPLDGTDEGSPATAAATIANTPPAAPTVAILPRAPSTSADVRGVVTAAAVDPDGDLVSYAWQWWRDEQLVPDVTTATVPASLTRKGERWRVSVRPQDDKASGAAATAETTIVNTPPRAPRIRLSAALPATTDDVRVEIVEPATDEDGDPVRLRCRWLRNGKPAGIPEDRSSVLPAETHKADVWSLEVTAFDGMAASPPARAGFRVRNTPPTVPEVVIDPERPTTADVLVARIVKPATDADGDTLAWRYRWLRDGVPYDVDAAAPDRVPAAATARGELWGVEATAWDGEAGGEPARAQVAIGNTAPTPPAATVRPAGGAALTGKDLECVVTTPAADGDGDAVELGVRWLRDGTAVAGTAGLTTLPGGMVRKGETWRCEVTARDDEATLAPVGAEIRIGGAPPSKPEVALWPAQPGAADDVRCHITRPSTDPDGDAVTYRYKWLAGGREVAGVDGNVLGDEHTGKGDTVRCVVTPWDGEQVGESATADATVVNRAPGPPVVRVEPGEPRAGQPLECRVATQSRDPDGDSVTYDFAWFKDGIKQGAASSELPGRLVRKNDIWRCEAVPSDTVAAGPKATSGDVVVAE